MRGSSDRESACPPEDQRAKYVRWLSQGHDYRVAAHTRFGFAFLEAETLVSAIHLDVFTVLSVARPVDSEVCFGSGSEVTANQSHARFTLESRHRLMSHVIKNRDSRAG